MLNCNYNGLGNINNNYHINLKYHTVNIIR